MLLKTVTALAHITDCGGPGMPAHVNTSVNYVNKTLMRHKANVLYIDDKLHGTHSFSPELLQILSEMQREGAGVLVRRKYKKYFKQKMTYLSLIAYVIQNAPEKRLPFCKIMNAVAIFVSGDKKGIENNIRVCLSSNNCFVKVPINPECPNAKRNYWKMDDSKITPKMLRRHFSCLRDVFPAFYENMEIHSAKNATENRVSCTRTEAENKFSSSFSIESLLKREAPVRPQSANRNVEIGFLGLANGDLKNKTWNCQNAYISLSQSHSHFSFSDYNSGQMNYGFSSCRGPSKMCSVSELSCISAPRQFTNVVIWAYR